MKRRPANRTVRFLVAGLAGLTALSGNALAYPIFYKCDADGRMNDRVDTNDLKAKIKEAIGNPAEINELKEICGGHEECMSVLKQALLLTRSTAEAAYAVYRKLEDRIAKLGDELESDPEIRDAGDIARNLTLMADAVNSCRQIQTRLKGMSFTYEGADGSTGLFVQHSIDNEYSLVSGIGRKPEQHRQTNYDSVGTVVQDALAADADPYMALAVAYLEAGQPEPFMLDPMPAMSMMGCSSTKLKVMDDKNEAQARALDAQYRKEGKSFYYNWGTFYQFKPQVGSNATTTKLAARMNAIKDVPSEASAIQKDEPGYACVQDEGSYLTDANGKIVDAMGTVTENLAKSKACCMKIPYVSRRAFTLLANFALADKVKRGGKPEQVLQGFNGYGIIGITEKKGVGAFRYGMRMRDYPQYGAQGMDFILNSFMNNPMIRKFVEDAKASYGTNPKSLVCSGKKAGTYVVSSKKYTEMQKGMKRLHTVIGKTWDQMSGLEKAMVRHEYEFLKDMAGKESPKLTDGQNQAYQAAIGKVLAMGDGPARWNYYRSNVHPYRDTLYKTSLKSWEPLSDEEVLERRDIILNAPAQNVIYRKDYDAPAE